MLWSLTGLYMTAVHIDIIHGDHLLRERPPALFPAASLTDPLAAVAAVQGASAVRLATIEDGPVWIVEHEGGAALVDARTGRRREPPDEPRIRAIAQRLFAGDSRLASLRLIDELPGEIRGRKPPLWRAEFEGWNRPTFYLSPHTGELVTRRHELWRVFDFMWMLHIMDYDERENVNNTLLRVFTLGAVLVALSGAWMLLYAFPRRRRRAGK